jgi:hypothetical protein
VGRAVSKVMGEEEYRRLVAKSMQISNPSVRPI